MPALPSSILQARAQEQSQPAATPKLTDQQKALLEEANKLTAKNVTGGVTEEMLLANPNLNAQQLANKHVTDYWSNESEAFSRVNTAMNNGTAKLGQYPTGNTDEDGNPIMQLAITAGGHPGYDTLFLKPTGTPNVYSFTTRNQVAGGNISGIIGANPETGKYAPITNAAIQTGYTPGSPGGWIKNTLNDIGPLGNIALAVATGGLSIPEQLAAQTAMNLAKGQDFEDALKGAGLVVGGSQLVQGITSVDPVSGMDLAADAVSGNSLADVGAKLSADAGLLGLGEGAFPGAQAGTVASDAGITALTPDTSAAVTSPVTSGAVTEAPIPPANEGIEALTPELNVGTAKPVVDYTPELNVGTAKPVVDYTPELNVGTAGLPSTSTGIEALNPSAGLGEGSFPGAQTGTVASDAGITALTPDAGSLGTASDLGYTPAQAEALNSVTIEGTSGFAPDVPVTGMEPANPQDFGATVESGGVDAATVANPVGTGDPGSAPLDTTSTLPGENAGAPGSSYTTTAGGGIADITGAGAAAGVGTAAAGAGSGILPSIAEATGLPLGVVQTLAASLGISALGSVLQPSTGTITNAQGSYTGPLANYQFNPSTYTPYTYKPYAGGGAVEAMSNANAIGANTGFPMADIQRGAYATPYQQPISQNVVTGDQDTRVDPYTGEEKLAGGGITNLGGYSDGGRLLRGPGDGVSDSIPAMIGNRQPARLADGEFVIPARIVSEIGNGSTDAGARKLYEMMDRVQAARRKTTGKGKFAANTKADKYLPT